MPLSGGATLAGQAHLICPICRRVTLVSMADLAQHRKRMAFDTDSALSHGEAMPVGAGVNAAISERNLGTLPIALQSRLNIDDLRTSARDCVVSIPVELEPGEYDSTIILPRACCACNNTASSEILKLKTCGHCWHEDCLMSAMRAGGSLPRIVQPTISCPKCALRSPNLWDLR